MEEACYLIDAESGQGLSCHSRRFFPCCFSREDIACDMDEVAISKLYEEMMLRCFFIYIYVFS